MMTMSCSIKNIPPSDFIIQGTGNRGHGYPLTSECGIITQPILELCYLALETDPVNSPILLEGAGPQPYQSLPALNYWIAAPCVSAFAVECYIALQENGFTSIDVQETDDYFVVSCIQ